MFNIINTSGGDISIMGMSQGAAYFNAGATGVTVDWWYSDLGDYTVSQNWVSCGNGTVDLTVNVTTVGETLGGIPVDAIGGSSTITYGDTNTAGGWPPRHPSQRRC